MSPGARPRPHAWDELDFERRDPVVWFSLAELALTAKKLAISKVLGDFADKRELIGTLPAPGIHHYPRPDDEGRDGVWLDFVADLGDGFDATYSVASLIAAPKLEVPGPGGGATHTLPRADVLVMGGDEVYPAASIDDYEHRTVGPYRAALPLREEDGPDLFVVPGNHDWYDGLTAWMRVFAQGKSLGGWQTHQRRSYFALRLPGPWWLWGLDVQFDSYIDAPQLDYFRDLASEHVEPGDQIILCVATPEWVNSHRTDNPETYRNLDYFEREIIAPSGAVQRVALSGHYHHYGRYASSHGDRQRITSGGGGAYLSATHELPVSLTVPPADSTDRRKTDPPTTYHLAARYPSREVSRELGRGVWAFPVKNPAFTVLIGLVYTFFGWSGLSVAADPGGIAAPWDRWAALSRAVPELGSAEALLAPVGRPLSVLVTLLLLLTFVGLTKRRDPVRKLGVGLAHGLAHAVALVVVLWAVFSGIGGAVGAGWLPQVVGVPAVLVGVFVLGMAVGALVFAAYLTTGDRFGRNVNEQFSAMRLESFRNLLRLHVATDGTLTIFPIGLREVVHDWRVQGPDAPADAPWIVPAEGARLEPELIEAPIVLPPTPPEPPT